MAQPNPYEHLKTKLQIGNENYTYYNIEGLNDNRLLLLECAIRRCDEFNIKKGDVERILGWKETSKKEVEAPFMPARVVLQDFTGVPCVVDLAGMRDAMIGLGGDPLKINPQVPVDLVIDHSIQVDYSRTPDSKDLNEEKEFQRNIERFQFLKWGSKNFQNFLIVPPGSGIVHQVNLEYLAHVVYCNKKDSNLLYPDSCVGTDSHTTMINGLGVVGWGVGGLEAESVMMGETITMVLPEVVGFELTNHLKDTVTATDLVLTCVKMLRERKVVGKFVEFFGNGVQHLTLADRATISNMAPEYGATIGYFPVDQQAIDYLRLTGRSEQQVQIAEQYLRKQGMFRVYDGSQPVPDFSGAVLHLDLESVVPSVAGPKRPQDRISVSDLKASWNKGLCEPVSFASFGIAVEKAHATQPFTYKGQNYSLKNGSVVIAAITSCTNTSNPDVILGAALLAKNAVEKGLRVQPYIKTSLSPGSGVVEEYLKQSHLQQYLDILGFNITGFGCMTCIGNSGPLDQEVSDSITHSDLVVCSVLSGNRNFEGRVHQSTRANYLASPMLVVAYAIAGCVDFDFETQALGKDKAGHDVFLKDIWPQRSFVQQQVNHLLKPAMFVNNYQKIAQGTQRWNSLHTTEKNIYDWDEKSTYIHNPPFFKGMTMQLPHIPNVKGAYVLGLFGDSITTDHISPAGNISAQSPAGQFLTKHHVQPSDFNSYGSRRGNDLVMARGTFANTRIINLLMKGKAGPNTVHIPTNKEMPIYDAAMLYMQAHVPVIIIAGNEYGTGSSRDWAAKGPFLQGVKVVIAQSYERIHRSNLIGMGILPLEFNAGESAQTVGLSGHETFDIDLSEGNLKVNQQLAVHVSGGKTFNTKVRLDTDVEVQYFKNGGILNFVLRKLASHK